MTRLNVGNIRHPDGTNDNISLDSSGRVLIGTSTAGAFSNRRVSISTSSGTTALELRSATDGDSRIVFTDSTDSGDAGSYKGQISYDQSSDFMSFNTNGNNERMRLDSSGNLKFNSGYGSVATAYGCRAWVNFNGTGTVAIRASGNVSSITDNGTGNYTVNFTTALADANYSVVASSNSSSGWVTAHNTLSTSSANVRTYDATTSADSSAVCVSIFR